MGLKVLREPPAALKKLMTGIHQDFEFDVERAGSFEAAISRMPAEWLNADEREGLRPVLQKLLEEASPSELKGLLRRSPANYLFTAAQARTVFELWVEGLK